MLDAPDAERRYCDEILPRKLAIDLEYFGAASPARHLSVLWQTAAQLLRVKGQLAEYRRDLEQIDDRRRMSVLEDLQEAELKLAQQRVRLQSGEEKLQLAGVSVPRVNETARLPTITVIRRDSGAPIRLAAEYDDELEPGDIVEVEWRKDSTAANNGQGIGSASWQDARTTN